MRYDPNAQKLDFACLERHLAPFYQDRVAVQSLEGDNCEITEGYMVHRVEKGSTVILDKNQMYLAPIWANIGGTILQAVPLGFCSRSSSFGFDPCSESRVARIVVGTHQCISSPEFQRKDAKGNLVDEGTLINQILFEDVAAIEEWYARFGKRKVDNFTAEAERKYSQIIDRYDLSDCNWIPFHKRQV